MKRVLRGKKHSLALELSGLYAAYELATDDAGGATLAHRVFMSPWDKAQRDALKSMVKSGSIKSMIMEDTKPLQYVVLYKIGERLPLIGKPLKSIANAANKGLRPILGKKYNLI